MTSGCSQWEQSVYNGTREPKATFWTGPGCTGDSASFEIGDYPSLYFTRAGASYLGDNIRSAWIPPQMKAKLIVATGCREWPNVACNASTLWNYASGYSELTSGPYANIPGPAGGQYKTSALQLRPSVPGMTWSSFRNECCRGKLGDDISPEKCGPFWKKNSEDGSGYCDFSVREYCDVNPSDKFCACYQPPLTLSDPKEPGCTQIAPECYSADCASGVGYKPSDRSKLGCIACKICKQSIDIQGIGNVYTNNIMLSDCSTSEGKTVVKADSTTTTGGNVVGKGNSKDVANILSLKAAEKDADRKYKMMMMIIILIAIAVFATIWNSSDSPMGYPRGPPNGYPRGPPNSNF